MICFRTNGKLVRAGKYRPEILQQTDGLVMPGSTCFVGGESLEVYMRFSYVCGMEAIKMALERLKI